MSKRRSARRQSQRRSWVPALWAAAGLFVLAAVAWVAWPRPTAAIEVRGEPRLKVDREQVDLGQVKLGRTVEVTYQLTNAGDQPLRLSQAPYVEVVEGC